MKCCIFYQQHNTFCEAGKVFERKQFFSAFSKFCDHNYQPLAINSNNKN